MRKTLLATLPVAAFVAGMAVVPSVFAAGSDNNITNWTGLSACVGAALEVGKPDVVCALADDVTVDEGGLIKVGNSDGNGGGKVTINLAGHKLTSAGGGSDQKMFQIYNADLEIVGPGQVIYTGDFNTKYAFVLFGSEEHKTNLTIGSGVEMQNAGIAFATNNNTVNSGATLNFNGTLNSGGAMAGIYVNGKVKNSIETAPKINISDGVVINMSNSVAIYQAGNSTFNIGKATLTGTTGIASKAGVLNLNGTTVNANGKAAEPSLNSNGVNPTGSALQIESYDPPYQGGVTVHINEGSTLTSANNYAIQTYGTKGDGITEVVVSETGVRLQSAAGKDVVSNTAEGFKGVTNPEGQVIAFGDTSVWPIPASTPETPAEENENPNTADPIALYATVAVLAVLGLGATAVLAKKFNR